MTLSLEQILANPELEKSVPTEWIQTELQKQPFNRYLQGLLDQRVNEKLQHSQIIDSIISETTSISSYYIRDVEIDDQNTFAEAQNKSNQESTITKAAIGAGAIVTGSILTGAQEAAESVSKNRSKPVSNTDQIEESGLLGFLNRLDGTISRKEANPAVDPMLKEKNYHMEKEVILDLTEDLSDDAESIPEQIPTLPEKDEEEDGPLVEKEVLDLTKNSKKKKKKHVKAKKQYRWSSQTPADYKIKDLSSFTEWINKIDGVTLVSAKKAHKKKKKKKKKKRYEASLEVKPDIASEQLADLLINQGHYADAIAMYEQLSLKNPEKSGFFAAKIETIKDKL